MNKGVGFKSAASKYDCHDRQGEPPPANTAFESEFYVLNVERQTWNGHGEKHLSDELHMFLLPDF
jgi:hypothetical protein